MKIHLHSSVYFEKWNWMNAENGIGGSETHHIENAWRLARRGHEVISYCPLPEDSPREWRGTIWKDISEADFSEPGLWVMYRNPQLLDKFEGRPDQRVWFMCQDEAYGTQLSQERASKVEKFLVLSPWHKNIFKAFYPFLTDDKLCL